MQQMRVLTLCSFLFLFLFLPSAYASLPEASVGVRRGVASIGLGWGGIVGSLDYGIDGKLGLGGSAGALFFYGSNYVWDVHVNYQFIEAGIQDVSLSGIFGVWGGTWGWNWRWDQAAFIAPEFGVALSYPFDSRLTGRANIVYGPAWGVELGYKFNPRLEGVLAFSIQMIGIKFIF